MPQYFFNIHTDGGEARDPEGQCLPDIDAAREEAVTGAREIAADRVRSDEVLDLGARVEITDASGTSLLTVPFSEALVIKPT
jgi:hypothetical protein